MTPPKKFRGRKARTGDAANNRLVVLLDDAEWAALNQLVEESTLPDRSSYVRALIEKARAANGL